MTPNKEVTPEAVFRAVLDGACKLQNGDRAQVDLVAGYYGEVTDVRHPMLPSDTPLLSREEVRQRFAEAGASGLTGFRVEDLRIHRTADPEVVVGEFAYRGDGGWTVPGVIVVRVRDGLIVESRDYLDHAGFGRATNDLRADRAS
ncbi:nuclear transport factor 2 family protein [Lentzea sp. NPDC059081]|uniref:nuclear transport factor 2 family protein n=1 Tax=Lentzea sp. NPDC059081 TaxID=3346719 RepID=UPI00368AF90A